MVPLQHREWAEVRTLAIVTVGALGRRPREGGKFGFFEVP